MTSAGEAHKYRNMREVAAHIVEREGVRSLFKGSLVNILRGCAGAATLSLYDKFSALLVKVEKEQGVVL